MYELAAHHDALLQRGRCGRCAERVPRRALLQRGQCPTCDAGLGLMSESDLVERVSAGWWSWRLVGYAAVGVASFFAGLIPLAQSALIVVALFVLHVALLRRPLRWLSPGRRVSARFTVKLWGALLAVANLLLNVAVAPLLGVSASVLAVSGFVATVLYVEGGLSLIRQRMRWESQGRPLAAVEWGLPVALLGGLSLVALATVGGSIGALYLLMDAQIPLVSELVRWMLEA